MTPAILAPGLDATQAKLLRVAVQRAGLPWTDPVPDLSTVASRFVISAGKDALDSWHDFGLIRVGRNHGDLFTHRQPTTARTFHIMVVEHPGAMQQMRFDGMAARDNMLADLARLEHIMRDTAISLARSRLCGGCLRAKDARDRTAEFWVEELDMVGLCDDHYRRRAQYKRKVKRVAKKDAGKMEHQIEGQMEMLPGDGTRVMVSKS